MQALGTAVCYVAGPVIVARKPGGADDLSVTAGALGIASAVPVIAAFVLIIVGSAQAPPLVVWKTGQHTSVRYRLSSSVAVSPEVVHADRAVDVTGPFGDGGAQGSAGAVGLVGVADVHSCGYVGGDDGITGRRWRQAIPCRRNGVHGAGIAVRARTAIRSAAPSPA